MSIFRNIDQSNQFRKDFRKDFKNKYYKHYNSFPRIKKPLSYVALLVLALILLLIGLILHFLYLFAIISNVYMEIWVFLFATIALLIIDSKYTYKVYKKKVFENSLLAIDLTFEEIWNNQNICFKEKCIEIFKKKYEESVLSGITRIFNKSFTLLLTIIYICVSLLYPEIKNVKSDIVIVLILVVEYFGMYIPTLVNKLYNDYLYDRVINDYRYFLADRFVNGSDKSISIDTSDTSNNSNTSNESTLLGVVFIAIGIVLFPVIVIIIGNYYHDSNYTSMIISYAGSIFGGSITLIGVYLTIKTTSNQRREDLALQYMPILKERIVPYVERSQLCSEVTYLFNTPFFNDNDIVFCNEQIELENVGRGEIVNSNIKVIDVNLLTATGENILSITPSAYVLGDGFFQFVPINGKIVLYVAYPKFINLEYNKKFYISIETTVGIEIKGIISDNTYRYRLHYFLDINIDEKNTFNSKIRTVTLIMDNNF